MKVRGKKIAPRKTRGGEPTPKMVAQSHVYPAPIRGWILNENLATPAPGGALVLDNYVCTMTGARPRGGARAYATLGAAVQASFSYKSGASEIFFGATETSIFDITSVVDPLVVPTASVSGQGGGYYTAEQFGTVGGDYLLAVNGVDDTLLFDGTTWTPLNAGSSPAFTGVDTSTLSHAWSFANRMFFVESGTMSAWFLPVDSIAGAATEFSLSGIFRKGGTLLLGATWSLDAGDGLDDKCVFVSTEGEVAVYEGTNPSSAADWRLVGVYNISRPLGKNATMQAGGDLLIATEIGLIPISKAISKDTAALEIDSVSAAISPYWQERASALSGRGWEILKWPQKNIMVVTQPGDMNKTCLVANLQTGAWSRFTGWDTDCFGYFDEQGYFGGADGVVYAMEQTGSDNGENYTCVFLGLFDSLGYPGVQKTAKMARAIFESSSALAPQTTMAVNFDETLSTPPNSAMNELSPNAWDVAVWDQDVWDGTVTSETADRWVSIGRTGYSFAPEIQMTFGVSQAPVAELVSFDVTFEVGALVA